MKLRHLIAGVVFSPLLFVAIRGSALAQDAEDLPPAIAKILLQIAILTDGILNRWVDSATGNTLTDPDGQLLAADVAQVAKNSVSVLNADSVPPELAKVIIQQIAVLTDGILSLWVSGTTGNTLTDPAGQQLVADLAQVVVYLVDFLAQLTTLF
jgi:hypothetical protein